MGDSKTVLFHRIKYLLKVFGVQYSPKKNYSKYIKVFETFLSEYYLNQEKVPFKPVHLYL